MRSRGLLAIYVSLAALCACSGGDGVESELSGAVDLAPGEGLGDTEASEGRERVLAEFETSGFDVAFIETTAPDGSTSLWLRESAPIGASGSPLQLTVERGLTALEIFRALAPADQIVPERILAAHAEQARGLQRDDIDSVLDVVFEPPPPSNEKSIASCNAWVFTTMNRTYDVINKAQRNNLLNDATLYTRWTGRAVTLGACNDSPAAMETVLYSTVQPSNPAEIQQIDLFGYLAGNWTTYPVTSLPGRTDTRWYHWIIVPPERCNGLVCVRPPVKYAVRGLPLVDSLYHLRAAELVPIIR